MNIDNLEICTIDIDPELGRTEAEFSFLGTCDDIIGKLRRGRRYDIIRASGLLRHLFMDEVRLLDAANKRFKLKVDFHNWNNDSDLTKEAFAILRKYDSLAWISPHAALGVMANQRLKLSGFLKLPVVFRCGDPLLTVGDVISTCAHVYGGIHSGKPKSEQDKIILEMDEAMQIDGGEPSIHALYGICIVALDGVTPLVQAIMEEGATDDWPE